jgi:sugar lactone lactonase YvrE
MNTYTIKITGTRFSPYVSLSSIETYCGGDILDPMASPLSFYYPSSAIGGTENVTFSGSFSVSLQEFSPQSVFLKSDGRKMYVLGTVADRVYEYDLNTPWDITTSKYNNKSFFINSQEASSTGLFFKNDGLKMYLVGVNNDQIQQYTLTNAWQVSSSSYDNKKLSVGTQQNTPTGIYIKPDGTTAYVIGTSGSKIHQYTLPTPWDMSSGFYSLKNYTVSAEEEFPEGISFKSDGTSFYIVGSVGKIFEYELSSPWDISSASFSNNTLTVVDEDPTMRDIFIDSNGNNVYLIGNTYNQIHLHQLKNPWEINERNLNYSLTSNGGDFSIYYNDLQNIKETIDTQFIFCESEVNFDFSEFDQSKSRIIKLTFDPNNGLDKQFFNTITYLGETIYPRLDSIKTKYYPSSSFYTYYNPKFFINYEDGNYINLTLNLTSIQCGIYESYKDKSLIETIPYYNNSSNVLLLISDNIKNNIFISDIYTRLPFILSANVPENDIEIPNLVKPVPFFETIEGTVEPIYVKPPNKNNPVLPPTNIYVYSEYEGTSIIINNTPFYFGDEFEVGSGLTLLSGGAPYFAGNGISINVVKDLNN